MKKTISIVLVLVICLGLSACGKNNSVKLTETELRNQISDSDIMLNIKETSGEYVTSFTLSHTGVSANTIKDKERLYDDIDKMFSGNYGKMSYSGALWCIFISELASIKIKLDGFEEASGDTSFLRDTTINACHEMIDFLSDGTTLETNGWKLTSNISEEEVVVYFES